MLLPGALGSTILCLGYACTCMGRQEVPTIFLPVVLMPVLEADPCTQTDVGCCIRCVVLLARNISDLACVLQQHGHLVCSMSHL